MSVRIETKIKSNIIQLDQLHNVPCDDWLERFIDGKMDADIAFRTYGEKYFWLYKNSQYDLIGWQIENNSFDWERYSWAVAMYCPQYFNTEKYNWEEDSWAVAKYCPDKLDQERYKLVK